MTTKTVYLAGPMSGIPQFNFPAFDAARDQLVADGWNVVSPADHDRETYPGVITDDVGFQLGDLDQYRLWDQSSHDVFLWDIQQIMEADAIALLPGWNFSQGAKAEYAVALKFGLEVIYLDEAQQVIF